MYLKLRDPLSGLTHCIGAVLAVFGLISLLLHADSNVNVVSFSIFGSAMIMLYLASTLYHWLPLAGKKLELFRKIDHIMIFIFISATYTPICLSTLSGAWGWSIFGVIWGIAIAGLFFKLFWLNAPRILYTMIYLIMGWTIIVALWPLSERMPVGGLSLLGLGGLFYSLGALIYAFKKPDPWPETFGFHEIFHIFVMLGTTAHYFMIYFYA